MRSSFGRSLETLLLPVEVEPRSVRQRTSSRRRTYLAIYCALLLRWCCLNRRTGFSTRRIDTHAARSFRAGRSPIGVDEPKRVAIGVTEAIEVSACGRISRDWINRQKAPDRLVVIPLLHIRQPGPAVHHVPGVADPAVRRLADHRAVRLVVVALDHRPGRVRHRHRAPQRVGVLVLRRDHRVARPVVVDDGHHAARQVDVLVGLLVRIRRALPVAGERHLARLRVLPERRLAAVGLRRLHPAAQAVVAVRFLPRHRPQAIAVVEVVGLPVPVADVALQVVPQAHHRRPAVFRMFVSRFCAACTFEKISAIFTAL